MTVVARFFVDEWALFCRHILGARERFGVHTGSVYLPNEKGKASVTLLCTQRRDDNQVWKVLWWMRERGWACKLVPGVMPTLTVDLTMPPAEDDLGGAHHG